MYKVYRGEKLVTLFDRYLIIDSGENVRMTESSSTGSPMYNHHYRMSDATLRVGVVVGFIEPYVLLNIKIVVSLGFQLPKYEQFASDEARIAYISSDNNAVDAKIRFPGNVFIPVKDMMHCK